EVRRDCPNHLALAQGRAHQPEAVLLKVAQAAVDQLRRARGSAASEVTHLAQKSRQDPAGGVAGDAAAIDAAADNGKVEDFRHPCSPATAPFDQPSLRPRLKRVNWRLADGRPCYPPPSGRSGISSSNVAPRAVSRRRISPPR